MNIKKIIREEMGSLNWIKDEELPILPYIGKRFKLIRDDGQDSGRRYQILEYYFEDKYNKDFYVKSIMLNPETLKPRTETPTKHKDLFSTPLNRAMELINNGNWVFLDPINESQDGLDWIRDSDPIEVINLNDEWHVNTIKEGDKMEITGKYDGIEFYNEPCEVVCVSTCSHRKAGNAWNHQILISFEREFYSKETDEETHCGPDYISEKKCNCREVDGVISHDGEPFLVGTCWWVLVFLLWMRLLELILVV
jgi:hypothetical protein